MLRIQTLANFIEMVENTYHVIYILLSGVESSFWTPYTSLVFQQKHVHNPFKYLRWIVLVGPVNDFKSLTVFAKTFHLRCLNGFGIRVHSECI